MKQAFLLIISMALTLSSYSQKTDSLPDTAQLTLSKVYSDVKAGISGLAESLKVPASHVYSIMIKQQVAQSISNLIFVVGFVIASIILYKAGMRTYKLYNAKENEDLVGVTILTFVLCGVCTIISIGSFWSDYSSIITGFTNPEYGAIKEIVNFVK